MLQGLLGPTAPSRPWSIRPLGGLLFQGLLGEIGFLTQVDPGTTDPSRPWKEKKHVSQVDPGTTNPRFK